MSPVEPARGDTAPDLRLAPTEAAERCYDVLVVGGGVVGAATLLEATRRGLSALLIERDDFGQHTTGNSLRIVHGGLRYLQHLDLVRHQQSVGERSRWLRDFPDLVSPLPCLMPLSGRGVERRWVLRLALAADAALSPARNHALGSAQRLASGRVLDVAASLARCPLLDPRSLVAGALWWDARLERPQRLLIELLRWAVAGGAVALNRVAAEELVVEGGEVRGALARDLLNGETLTLRATSLINTAGPWCRQLASRLDPAGEPHHGPLFRPSLALNLLLDRPAWGDTAVAVAPEPGAARLFLVPWRGRLLAGTHHAALPNTVGPDDRQALALARQQAVDDLLANLGRALPALALDHDAVRHVLWGLLPAEAAGSATLARRPVVWSHRRRGGPGGLVSVSGIKLTTARWLARQALDSALGPRSARPLPRPPAAPWPTAAEAHQALADDRPGLLRRVAELADGERVATADDLLLRRTGWGLDPDHGEALAEAVAGLGLGARG